MGFVRPRVPQPMGSMRPFVPQPNLCDWFFSPSFLICDIFVTERVTMRKRRKYVPVTDVGYIKTIIVTYRYVGNFFCIKRERIL